ncbi:helix-turn-helix domain-containing protein [Trabulsiella odontotermitis]|uniref:helix-turn-helix domain-containing protein n=1 Tax=Trabulsiella odontotermitis TaxID=379893 RepID=UPI0006760875|nr:helix-turn-helix transcriptional regulator [Trabulsiella odontotermitis]
MNSNGYKEKTEGTDKNRDRFFLRYGINRFPERLKQAMENAHLPSNNQLAKKTELSESTIRKYLKGETYPTLDRLALLAEACSCSMSWLATGEGDGNHAPLEIYENSVNNNESRNSELDVVLSYLSTEQKEKFMRVIYTRGIAAILRLDDDIDAQFLALPEEEKSRLLRLHEQVKKGASEGCDGDDLTNSTNKHAG